MNLYRSIKKIDETDKYEFKELLNDSLPKEIEAFLNTDGGGYVFIGVNKNGEIVGIKKDKLDKILLKVADIITDQILPSCTDFVHVHHETIDNKDIVQIDIKRGNKLYYQKKYGMTPRGCHFRVGTKCQEMTPEEIEKRFIASLNIPEPDICEIESHRQDLTFAHLKNYLISKDNHINENTFYENYNLLTSKGKFNRMAEILADKNDIIVNVMTFKGKDKTEYLKRNEFGYTCLLLACERVKNYVNSINETYVKVGTIPRQEKKMFDLDAFEQAWINACVHNKWAVSNHPGVYIYEDRLVIESQGGIPKALTKEKFLQGVSEPVNKALMDIFIKCDFCEESGHGVPAVVNVYGNDAYEFSDHFIDVTIPFDKTGFGGHEPQNEPHNQMKLIERIVDIVRNNPSVSKIKIAEALGVSLSTVKRELSKYKKIKYVGPSKGGHWEIKED